MRNGAICILAAFVAIACEKKSSDATKAAPRADAGDTPTSCLHPKNARAFVWRSDPLQVALDVELDGTCAHFAPESLELTDVDLGAKLGEQKRKELYRIDADGTLGEWDDPYATEARGHALFVYALSTTATAVGVRYGTTQLLPRVTVLPGGRPPPPTPSVRVLGKSIEPTTEPDRQRVIALVALENAPRTAGRRWGDYDHEVRRTLVFELGQAERDASDRYHLDVDHVVDVDDKLAPIETEPGAMPLRPAKRLLLAGLTATNPKSLFVVTLRTIAGELHADAVSAPPLVLSNEARARLASSRTLVDKHARDR